MVLSYVMVAILLLVFSDFVKNCNARYFYQGFNTYVLL